MRLLLDGQRRTRLSWAGLTTPLRSGRYKPTQVIHLAALVGGLFKNMKYKLTFLRDNCLMNDNVMWASKEHNVRSGSHCDRPATRR